MARSEALKRAQKKYSKTLYRITLQIPITKYGKLIEHIQSKKNKRRWLIEACSEKMESELNEQKISAHNGH